MVHICSGGTTAQGTMLASVQPEKRQSRDWSFTDKLEQNVGCSHHVFTTALVQADPMQPVKVSSLYHSLSSTNT